MKRLTPPELLSTFDPERKRIDVGGVVAIIEAIINKDFKIEESSGVFGPDLQNQWVTIKANGYRLWFFYRYGIQNCFACLTPKGSEYNMDTDGGIVIADKDYPIPTEEWQKLDLLVSKHRTKSTDRKVGVRQCWIVVNDADTDHWNKVGEMYDKGLNRDKVPFPKSLIYGGGIFYEKKDAEKAAKEYVEYRSQLL